MHGASACNNMERVYVVVFRVPQVASPPVWQYFFLLTPHYLTGACVSSGGAWLCLLAHACKPARERCKHVGMYFPNNGCIRSPTKVPPSEAKVRRQPACVAVGHSNCTLPSASSLASRLPTHGTHGGSFIHYGFKSKQFKSYKR